MDRTDRLMWVARNLPEECKLALERFTWVNFNWCGANWEDCLDILLDSDSHLELTEPMYEALGEMSPEISVTLLYAYGGEPTFDEVRAHLERVPWNLGTDDDVVLGTSLGTQVEDE